MAAEMYPEMFYFRDPLSKNPKKSFTGNYDMGLAYDLIEKSHESEYNPYRALGTAMAETTFGTRGWPYWKEKWDFPRTHPNPLGVDFGLHGEPGSREEAIQLGIDLLKSRGENYGGAGKLGPNTERDLYGGVRGWYGKPGVVDQKVEYNKRVDAFAEEMYKNPDIRRLVMDIKRRRTEQAIGVPIMPY